MEGQGQLFYNENIALQKPVLVELILKHLIPIVHNQIRNRKKWCDH
jgi:hypothetical protein